MLKKMKKNLNDNSYDNLEQNMMGKGQLTTNKNKINKKKYITLAKVYKSLSHDNSFSFFLSLGNHQFLKGSIVYRRKYWTENQETDCSQLTDCNVRKALKDRKDLNWQVYHCRGSGGQGHVKLQPGLDNRFTCDEEKYLLKYT